LEALFVAADTSLSDTHTGFSGFSTRADAGYLSSISKTAKVSGVSVILNTRRVFAFTMTLSR
jgi:hypothetical protein